jgi:Chaperone of endosialidase
MGGGDYSEDPNQGIAAQRAVALQEDQMKWMREVYETDLKPLSTRQTNLAIENAELGMDIAKEQRGYSQEDRKFQLENFRPIEQQLTNEVAQMNTGDYADRKALDSQAQVEEQYGAAQAQARRNLARSGISINSGQAAASELNGAVNKAAITAQARTQARDQADGLTFARKSAVAGMGRNLPGDAAQAASLSLASGQGAAAGVGQALQGRTMASGGIQGSVNAASQANTSYAQILGDINAQKNKSSAAEAASNNQLAGSALGALAMYAVASDENMKEDIKEVDGDAVRKGLRKAEPKSWRYLPDKGLPEGEHMGAMAQDLQKNLGDKVSDGKTVKVVSMLGALHTGVVEVDKRVDKVTKQIDKLVSAIRAKEPALS